MIQGRPESGEGNFARPQRLAIFGGECALSAPTMRCRACSALVGAELKR